MADNSRFESTVASLFKGMDGFLSGKTVVGEPITVGDTIIVPLVDISFGVAAGAGAKEGKNKAGGGMGGKMSPSAVLIIHDGITRLVNVKNQDKLTKLIDIVPDLIDKFTKKKEEDPAVDEAVKDAFKEK